MIKGGLNRLKDGIGLKTWPSRSRQTILTQANESTGQRSAVGTARPGGPAIETPCALGQDACCDARE